MWAATHNIAIVPNVPSAVYLSAPTNHVGPEQPHGTAGHGVGGMISPDIENAAGHQPHAPAIAHANGRTVLRRVGRS